MQSIAQQRQALRNRVMILTLRGLLSNALANQLRSAIDNTVNFGPIIDRLNQVLNNRGGSKRKPSPWLLHVKKVKASMPKALLKDVLKKASQTYKK